MTRPILERRIVHGKVTGRYYIEWRNKNSNEEWDRGVKSYNTYKEAEAILLVMESMHEEVEVVNSEVNPIE